MKALAEKNSRGFLYCATLTALAFFCAFSSFSNRSFSSCSSRYFLEFRHFFLINGTYRCGHAGSMGELPEEIQLCCWAFMGNRDRDNPETFEGNTEHKAIEITGTGPAEMALFFLYQGGEANSYNKNYSHASHQR